MLFIIDIVGAAHAPEGPHNSCLSETLAPIMKFPTHAQEPLLFAHTVPLYGTSGSFRQIAFSGPFSSVEAQLNYLSL